MNTNKGTKIKSVWKCRKCGEVRYFYGSGNKPKICFMPKCKGDMKRTA